MKLAHLSDLHVLNLENAVPMRLLNKRLTGYANLRLRRNHKHKPEPVRRALASLRGHGVDHLVITGDLSNLALEGEFDRVRDLIVSESGLPESAISIVPGNHDVYTRGSHTKKRFATWFAPYLRSDLDLADGSTFPFVHLRGPLAIIGLSTAVPQLPFVAAGRLGVPQINALTRILLAPELRGKTPVILQHHPIDNPASKLKSLLEGLSDADAELRAFGERDAFILHGHWHKRLRRTVKNDRGASIEVIGATSASLLHEDHAKVAGFNLMTFDAAGALTKLETARYDERTREFSISPM